MVMPPDDEVGASRGRVASPAVGRGGGDPSPIRLLVVEDDEATRSVLVRLLGRRGFEVSAAATVAEGIERGRAGPVDLLLSDIGLPDGTGHDVLRQLRRDLRAGLPAVAMSGFGTEADIRRSLEAGFSVHLVKPLDLRELEAALRASLAGRRPPVG